MHVEKISIKNEKTNAVNERPSFFGILLPIQNFQMKSRQDKRIYEVKKLPVNFPENSSQICFWICNRMSAFLSTMNWIVFKRVSVGHQKN